MSVDEHREEDRTNRSTEMGIIVEITGVNVYRDYDINYEMTFTQVARITIIGLPLLLMWLANGHYIRWTLEKCLS